LKVENLKWRISCYPALAIAIFLLAILINDLGKQMNVSIADIVLTIALPVLAFVLFWGGLLGLFEIVHWIIRNVIRAARKN